MIIILLSGLSGLSGRFQDKTKLLIMLLTAAWVISAIVALVLSSHRFRTLELC